MTAVPGQAVEPGERGATRIADRVVAKIAARAAREALPAVPEDGMPPYATVTVHRDTARVRVSLELDYPTDIGARCGAVRRQVAERVEALAGMEVPEVTVHVERLHSPQSREAAQGRTR
ncbi:Asp23/Gls24 family envelope stress response protein [Streptomyces sp. NPDC058001]|uniref:Asp23/Gls24 family envelope stress response protein n=1 Tax=Streptomyces sp. NPDC058001 TaxID=3346300 RepID=UPI0036ED567C